MGEVVVQPWLLRLSLWVLLFTGVALVTTIVMARLARRRRVRRIDRHLAPPLRRDILAIAADDDAHEAEGRLRRLRGRRFDLVEPLLISYLSKVRGAPTQRIVDLLTAHGLGRRARAGLSSWSSTRRARSVWALGVMRSREATDEVTPLLQDRDRGVSVTAARALGMMRAQDSARALLEAVAPGRRGRGDLPVWVVVEALGGLGPGPAEVIGTALESPDPSTRTAAAMAIGRAQHLSQRQRLRSLAGEEQDPTVLAAVAHSLGELGHPADVPALAGLTADGFPRAVRLEAVSALGDIGDPTAVATLTLLLADEDARVGELAGPARRRTTDWRCTPCVGRWRRGPDGRGARAGHPRRRGDLRCDRAAGPRLLPADQHLLPRARRRRGVGVPTLDPGAALCRAGGAARLRAGARRQRRHRDVQRGGRDQGRGAGDARAALPATRGDHRRRREQRRGFRGPARGLRPGRGAPTDADRPGGARAGDLRARAAQRSHPAHRRPQAQLRAL